MLYDLINGKQTFPKANIGGLTRSNWGFDSAADPVYIRKLDGSLLALLEEVFIDVIKTKNIITTSITGGAEVLEYVGNAAWEINLKGFVTASSNEIPLEAAQTLADLVEMPTPLQIQSDFLTSLGITQVIILEFSIAQTTFLNQLAFNMRLKSHIPIELSYDSDNATIIDENIV